MYINKKAKYTSMMAYRDYKHQTCPDVDNLPISEYLTASSNILGVYDYEW